MLAHIEAAVEVVRPTAGLDAGDEVIEFGGIGLGVALDKEVERLVG